LVSTSIWLEVSKIKASDDSTGIWIWEFGLKPLVRHECYHCPPKAKVC